MNNAIEILEERDDVEKSEYTRRNADGDRVTVELWHDSESLQALFQKSMEGAISQKSYINYGEEQALAIRKTTVNYDIPHAEIADYESDRNE